MGFGNKGFITGSVPKTLHDGLVGVDCNFSTYFFQPVFSKQVDVFRFDPVVMQAIFGFINFKKRYHHPARFFWHLPIQKRVVFLPLWARCDDILN